LKEENLQRRSLLEQYRGTQPALLSQILHEDLLVWQLCDQRLLEALQRRQDGLQHLRATRWALDTAILGLLTLSLWLLHRRLTRQEVLQARDQGSQSYRALYQGLPLPAFVYDLGSRRISDANPAAAKLLGVNPEDIAGMSLTSFVAEEHRAAFAEKLRTRDLYAEVHDSQRIVSRDGRQLDVEVHAHYVELDGRPLRMVILQDVTEARAAQDRLRDSEQRFRALIENTPDIVMILRGDGTRRYQNVAVASILTGWSQEELISFPTLQLLHAEDRPEIQRQLALSMAEPGRKFSSEIRIQRKDGQWIYFGAVTVSLMDNPEVGGILVQLRDLSASREAQRQLLRLERMAAVGQITAGLAHEVRNPLAIISARTEFLLSQLPAASAQREDLDSILRQVERLRELVNQVLERARSQELSLREADVAELMESALKAACTRYGSAAEMISVVRDLPAGLTLKLDVAQMERVLLNLILNALQALSPGGSLTLSARREGPGTWLGVADNGPGIPEEKLARIFEPFFTTKKTGSGLGLWICKSIVEQHRGRLEVENLRPQGCRFNLYLPPDPGVSIKVGT
jgi:PAS domain S-box-containing protein